MSTSKLITLEGNALRAEVRKWFTDETAEVTWPGGVWIAMVRCKLEYFRYCKKDGDWNLLGKIFCDDNESKGRRQDRHDLRNAIYDEGCHDLKELRYIRPRTPLVFRPIPALRKQTDLTLFSPYHALLICALPQFWVPFLAWISCFQLGVTAPTSWWIPLFKVTDDVLRGTHPGTHK